MMNNCDLIDRSPPVISGNHILCPKKSDSSHSRINLDCRATNDEIAFAPIKDVLNWMNTDSGLPQQDGNINDVILDLERPQSNFINSDAYSDITDPLNSSESRPGSRLLSDADLGSMSWQDSPDMNSSHEHLYENTYFISLANSHTWAIAGDFSPSDHSSPPAVSPFFVGSRDSPIGTDVSFYEDTHKPFIAGELHYVPERGRSTPPPPYRPPVQHTPTESTKYCDIFHQEEGTILPKFVERLTPPPPYHSATNNTSQLENPTCNINPKSPSTGLTDFASDVSQFSPAATPVISGRTFPPSTGPWDVPMPSSRAEDQASESTKTTSVHCIDEEERKVFVPADPEQWNKDHILEWLKWVEVTFSTSPIDGTCMPADGATLCNLTAEDFRNITGDSMVAGILFSHLTARRQACGLDPKPLSDGNSASEKNGKNFLDSVRELIGENFTEEDKDLTSSNGGGQIQLWQFLIYLLQQPGNESLIALEGDDGEFRLLDPEGVAKKWGDRKSKPNMNYDKLSRALRYYYDKGILSKVNGKRYTYKFDVNGLRRAIRPTGLSDTYFIQPNFDVSNYTSIRNFNFPNLLLDRNLDGSSLLSPIQGSSEGMKFR